MLVRRGLLVGSLVLLSLAHPALAGDHATETSARSAALSRQASKRSLEALTRLNEMIELFDEMKKNGTPFATQANKDLTALSKSAGTSKRWLLNLILDKGMADDLDLDRDNNCVQLTEFSDRTVVVDFFDAHCPNNSELGSTDHLKFTTAYSPMEKRDHYKLKLTGREVGEMEINGEGTEITLVKLCTDNYDANCIPSVSASKFIGAPTLLY